MADRIKTVSTYNGTSWGSEVPIGADASNVDVTLSNNTKSDLQTVLGSTPSGSTVTDRINSKVSTSGGDVADTVVSKNINNYDSSTAIGDDILTDTAATMSTNTSTLWSRFNLFRKKVSNNFANYFEKSNLVGLDPGVSSTGDDSTVYTTAAINNYLSNVIGYTSASAPEAGDVATQLSTLNSNITWMGSASGFTPNVTILLANGNVMTMGAQNLVAIRGLVRRGEQTDPEQNMIVFGSIAITTTQARTNLPTFYLADPWNPARKLIAHNAHFILCRVNGVIQYCYCTDNPPYFNVPGTWAANQEARFLISTVFTPYNS